MEKEEYNKEPVFYCTHCLSLKIKTIPGLEGLDFCDDCGATNIQETDINTWRNMYKEKYGFDYLNNN